MRLVMASSRVKIMEGLAGCRDLCYTGLDWRYGVTSERCGTVGHLVFDMVLFVLLCVVTVVQFATHRATRWERVLSLAMAVGMLGLVLGDPPH